MHGNTLQDLARRYFFEQQQAKNMMYWAIDETVADLIGLRFMVGEIINGRRQFFPSIKNPDSLNVEVNDNVIFATVNLNTALVSDILDTKHEWDEPLWINLKNNNRLLVGTLNAVGYHPMSASPGLQTFNIPSLSVSMETIDFGVLDVDSILTLYNTSYRL